MADFCFDAWEGLKTKIQTSQNNYNITDAELDKAFMRLLLEKKVCIYWHKLYFEKYTENQIVPWGLRIQIFPNVKKVNDSLKSSWEENLQSCSFNKLSILCKQYEHEPEQLDISISSWHSDHSSGVSSPRFCKRDKFLHAHLKDYTLSVINAKEGKFLRDKFAHKNGYAYRWAYTTHGKPTTKPSTSNVPTTDNEVPNSFSTSFSSSISTTYQDLSHE